MQRRYLWPLAAVLALAAAPAAEPVKVEVVRYNQLGDILRQLRGKVVVVDLWADW